MVEGLDYGTHAEFDAQVDQEMTSCEHRSARPLMQETLHASFLTPRTDRSVALQILKDTATVQNLSDIIGKAVVTSVATVNVQTNSELPKKQAPSSTPHHGPIPSLHTKSRSDCKKRHSKEKKQLNNNAATTRGDPSDHSSSSSYNSSSWSSSSYSANPNPIPMREAAALSCNAGGTMASSMIFSFVGG